MILHSNSLNSPRLNAHEAVKFNDSVHRAAAIDIEFRSRTARGSACNGLLLLLLGSDERVNIVVATNKMSDCVGLWF